MGRKKKQIAEKSCALTFFREERFCDGRSQRYCSFKRGNLTIKRAAALLPPAIKSNRKSGSGAPKTSPRTSKFLKREVTSYPSITSVEFENKYSELLLYV